MLSGPRLDAIFADDGAAVPGAGHSRRDRHDLRPVTFEIAGNEDPSRGHQDAVTAEVRCGAWQHRAGEDHPCRREILR